MRNSVLAISAGIEEERGVANQIEQRSVLDKVVLWLGLGVASITGLIAYLLVVQPLQNKENQEAVEGATASEYALFVVNPERVLEIAKTQVTAQRSMVVFARGTGVLIEEPSGDQSIALAKGALAFEAERQLRPVVTPVDEGDFLVTHGPAVVTFLFEDDLKNSPSFWAKYEPAEPNEREELLVLLATENLAAEAKAAKVVRVVKARARAKAKP